MQCGRELRIWSCWRGSSAFGDIQGKILYNALLGMSPSKLRRSRDEEYAAVGAPRWSQCHVLLRDGETWPCRSSRLLASGRGCLFASGRYQQLFHYRRRHWMLLPVPMLVRSCFWPFAVAMWAKSELHELSCFLQLVPNDPIRRVCELVDAPGEQVRGSDSAGWRPFGMPLGLPVVEPFPPDVSSFPAAIVRSLVHLGSSLLYR